jgi:hypothetical protein
VRGIYRICILYVPKKMTGEIIYVVENRNFKTPGTAVLFQAITELRLLP